MGGELYARRLNRSCSQEGRTASRHDKAHSHPSPSPPPPHACLVSPGRGLKVHITRVQRCRLLLAVCAVVMVHLAPRRRTNKTRQTNKAHEQSPHTFLFSFPFILSAPLKLQAHSSAGTTLWSCHWAVKRGRRSRAARVLASTEEELDGAPVGGGQPSIRGHGRGGTHSSSSDT